MKTDAASCMTREGFRTAVFQRDCYQCVVCQKQADVAHHIMERCLWDDGGYYLDNGASLCSEHHVQAEQTLLSCDTLRKYASIDTIHLPEHLDGSENYDKWGNVILSDGRRLAGELFYDGSVQKVLQEGDVLRLFTIYVKYPRTPHLPFSPARNEKSEISLDNLEHFKGKNIIVTEKMDGENTTLYPDYLHARSIDGRAHPSRDWVKNFHAGFTYKIPTGWRICGENLFAKHRIYYDNLKSYFLAFSIWNEKMVCLDWQQTSEWLQLLEIESVPVLYKGPWNTEYIGNLGKAVDSDPRKEGFVVRISGEFSYSQFRHQVAKYVKTNLPEIKINWMYQKIERNGLCTVQNNS
jgi:hypothetical protein